MVKKSVPLQFTTEEVDYLNVIAKSRSEKSMWTQRAKMLLAMMTITTTNSTMISKLGVSKTMFYDLKRKTKDFKYFSSEKSHQRINWLLNDRPRSGHPLNIILEEQQKILKITCEKPSDHGKSGSYAAL